MLVQLHTLNRYQAALIHLGLSLLIFIGLLMVITQLWYPDYLFKTSGGWGAVQLIIGIDLILGPVLTLIVFNPSKKSLKTDLAIIALVQTLALAGGSYTIYTTRPIAVVYHHPEFTTLYAGSELSEQLEDLIDQSPLTPAALFYDDPTGGFATKLEVEQFSLLFSSIPYQAPLLKEVGKTTPDSPLLSISLDRVQGKSNRLLVDLTQKKISGLDTKKPK